MNPKRTGYTLQATWIAGKNLLFQSCFFLVVCVITALIYGDTPDMIAPYLITSYTRLPNTFFSILLCSAGYILSVLLISVLAAERDKNLFTTSLIIRLVVYFLNILPIAVFREGLSEILGFCLVYFPVFYFIVQYIVEKYRPMMILKCGNNEYVLNTVKALVEIVPLILASILVYIFIPERFKSITWRMETFESMSISAAYFVYIVFFNCITFFTVEFGIACVKEENKKNHAKYYFRYHEKMFSRFYYLLRAASSQILGKLRKNISWLVFFIITVESIFEPHRSIGRNLVEGYGEDSVIIIQNAFYLFLTMFVINTIIDLLAYLFDKKPEPHSPDKKSEALAANTEPRLSIVFKRGFPEKNRIIKGCSFLVIYLLLFIFCYREYPIAGYYDFEANSEKTAADVIKKFWLETDFISEEILREPLCTKREKGGYNITKMVILDPDGIKSEIIPYFENADNTFYYIENNRNRHKSLNGVVVSISRSPRYEILSRFSSFIPIIGKTETWFRLSADTQHNTFSMRPLYLVVPFFALYFMTLFAIVYIITDIFYRYNIKNYIRETLYKSKSLFERRFGTCHSLLLKFINSATLFLFFLLANKFLEKHLNIEWKGMNFLQNLAAFGLVQLLIVWMFSDSYVQEIRLHIEKIFKSKEFEYYELTGVDHNGLYINYSKKYGGRLFLKLFIQNILFTANINFFIAYAFNVWNDFNDRIGLTYAIGIENIFTKIIHLQKGRWSMTYYTYLILFLFYGILFTFYYYLGKKQEKNG